MWIGPICLLLIDRSTRLRLLVNSTSKTRTHRDNVIAPIGRAMLAWAHNAELMLIVRGGRAEFERELIRARTGEDRKRLQRYGGLPKLGG